MDGNMGQIARVVVPGYPHHITERGDRRQQTFFCEEDYRAYLDLMSEWCSTHGVDIWAYCLMQKHLHLVACQNAEEKEAGAKRRKTRSIKYGVPGTMRNYGVPGTQRNSARMTFVASSEGLTGQDTD